MASSSAADSDRRRNGGAYQANETATKGAGTGVKPLIMDDLFRNPYVNSAPITYMDSAPIMGEPKTMEEMWREISGGVRKAEGGDGGSGAEITLEDFLARAGAVTEEDVHASLASAPTIGGIVPVVPDNDLMGFRSGEEGAGAARGGRGAKRLLNDEMDRSAVQRQKRMIKNRESAARSRERKQAYTVELEGMVTKLENENAVLLREKKEMEMERFRQLMENLKPVTEERKPRRLLRRTRSMEL